MAYDGQDELFRYEERLKELEAKYEALCVRCGECCGAKEDDPCAHLAKNDDGLYACKSYEARLGPQLTRSGEIFMCVMVKELINRGWRGADCGYCKFKKIINEENGDV